MTVSRKILAAAAFGGIVLTGCGGESKKDTMADCTAAAQKVITRVVAKRHDTFPQVMDDLRNQPTPDACKGLSEADQQKAVDATPFMRNLNKTMDEVQRDVESGD